MKTIAAAVILAASLPGITAPIATACAPASISYSRMIQRHRRRHNHPAMRHHHRRPVCVAACRERDATAFSNAGASRIRRNLSATPFAA
jgi:hypothetical protein